MKISKFLKAFTLIFIGILLLTSFVDAKSKYQTSIKLTTLSKKEKGKKTKKGASNSVDPEKSSIKRPAGTSAVNLTKF
jgi:hypothetical protein